MKQESDQRINCLKECLKEQLLLHPSMQPRDVVKLCYQAAYGAEHLLLDREAARTYFEREYAAVEAAEGPLAEQISRDFSRVNLAVWKQRGLPGEWLFRMFSASVDAGAFGEEALERRALLIAYLEAAGEIQLSQDAWRAYLEEYTSKEMKAVHHSELYREKEHPAYRVVNNHYIALLPILEKAAELQKSRSAGESGERAAGVIAIDGRAAAGKSTLAQQLRRILDAPIVQMDDFFLPMELRSEERLAVAGSNVHYERFAEEVLPFIREGRGFSYRRFDCSCMDYNGEVQVDAAAWRIVEGSYSRHPIFGEYADITVFCDVESDEQIRRIIKRNGTQMAEMFRTRWIPLEEAYFEAFQIKEKALILNQS